MKITRVLVALSLLATLFALGLSPAQAKEEVDKSDNVKLVKQFRYEGGTELAAIGDYVYSSQMDGNAAPPSRGTKPDQGGLHIFDVSGGTPKKVGFLHCPGHDNDVEVVKPGLVAMAFATNKCAIAAGSGVMLIDVKNPRKPRVVGMLTTGKSHTFKPFPGKPLIYMAGGSVAGGGAAGPVIVDVSNPRKPEIVARPQTITMDCHDISFSVEGERKLGFCAGAVGTGEVQIWDVSDPLKPTTIGRIYNPLIQYSHYAIASSDGTLLAIDDEAFAAHECNTGQSPTGRVWIYDISNPMTPIPQSSFAAPRGGGGAPNVGTYVGWVPSWCLSHGLDWQAGTHNVAVTWFTGGMSVLNLSSPTTPQEVAYFQAEDSTTYSALWHNDLLYTNDMTRGMDVFEVKGLPKN